MNIKEERAKDDLIWLKDNWVIDWAEPEQSRFKFAIEDILKVLDSKDKQIELMANYIRNQMMLLRMSNKTVTVMTVEDIKSDFECEAKDELV